MFNQPTTTPSLLFTLFLTFGLAAACDPAAESLDEQPAETNLSVTGSVDGNLLLELVNQYRTQGCTCGTQTMPPVDPVVWDEVLEEIVHEHSKDMSANGRMTHTGSDGSAPGHRLNRAGYTWRSYGENVAAGHRNEEAVMTAWINSSGHCRNIMSANKTHMATAREGGYWTQMFTKK